MTHTKTPKSTPRRNRMQREGKESAICEQCGTEECFEFGLTEDREKKVRDGGDGRWLCNDCWHAVRYALPAFYIRRKDGYSGPNTCTRTKAETEAFFAEHPEWYGPNWEVVQSKHWFGDRIAHPGYMAKRRASILAAHPEYA